MAFAHFAPMYESYCRMSASRLSDVVCYSTTEAEQCEGQSSDNVFLGSTCYTPEVDFAPVANFTNYTCTYAEPAQDCKTYASQILEGHLNQSVYSNEMPCNFESYIRGQFCDRTAASEEYFK